MALEQKVGFLSRLRKGIAGSALGLAIAGVGLLYSGKALAQDWPAPTNLGAVNVTIPENPSGSQINPERNGNRLFYDEQPSFPRMKLYMADINLATGEAENKRPYDLTISDPTNTDKFESHLTESADRLSAAWAEWLRTQGPTRSNLKFATRLNPDDPLTNITTILDNWDGQNPEAAEYSPSLSGNHLYFARECSLFFSRDCQSSANGIWLSEYPFVTAVRLPYFDFLVDKDNNPSSRNGRFSSIRVYGLHAIVAYTCDPTIDTNCSWVDIYGDFDESNDHINIAYFTRNNLTEPFQLASIPGMGNVNTATWAESGASLYIDDVAQTITLYYHTPNDTIPGFQQSNELVYSTTDLPPPPPCTSPIPPEVTGLYVERDRAGNLIISFDNGTVPDANYNLYPGQRSAIPSFAQVPDSTVCGIIPMPYGSKSAILYTPSATQLELFFLSASTCMGESPIGSSSTGVQYIPPDPCGPL